MLISLAMESAPCFSLSHFLFSLNISLGNSWRLWRESISAKAMRKPCCDKRGNNKGAWSTEEDQKLIDYIQTHGEGCWRSLPEAAGIYIYPGKVSIPPCNMQPIYICWRNLCNSSGLHRCGKSCRLRWINYLRPDIKRGNFGQDEEDLIIKLHALLGNRYGLPLQLKEKHI